MSSIKDESKPDGQMMNGSKRHISIYECNQEGRVIAERRENTIPPSIIYRQERTPSESSGVRWLMSIGIVSLIFAVVPIIPMLLAFLAGTFIMKGNKDVRRNREHG